MDRPLSILIATVFEYPHTGGLSTHVSTLKGALERAGHKVDVISVLSYPRWIYYLLVKGPSFIINRPAKGWGLVYSHFMRKTMIRLLFRLHGGAKRFDVVNAEDIFAVNAIAKAPHGASATGIPIVLTVHGLFRYEIHSVGSLREGTQAERYFIKEEERALARANAIVAVEKGRRNYLLSLGVPAEKVTVMTNFIEPDAMNETRSREALAAVWNAEGRFVILCPCRLARVKGVDIALESMIEVKKKVSNALILFAGDGELRGELEREARRHCLQDVVRFLGTVPYDEMPGLYKLADCIVIPSRSDKHAEEGVSLAALEAMASGKPLIATPVGGFKEIVRDGETGLLAEEDDSMELARKLIELASNPSRGEELGQRAREYVGAEHNADTAAARFAELFRDIVAKARFNG